MTANLNFVRQQGVTEATPQSCTYLYPALMWQPRVIGVLVLIGLVFQAWQYFLVLGLILWWSVLLPALNPFDAVYSHLVAKRKGLPPAVRAPNPRRFGAQPLAGTLMFLIAAALYFDRRYIAWGLEALLLVALVALIFARFCLGSFLYLLFTGRGQFARKTLPWSRDE